MSTSDWRRFYPSDIDIVEVESSNATKSDLPGPGRNLGKVYASLGGRVEAVLNGIAKRKGLGPSAIALRMIYRDYEREQRGHWLWIESSQSAYTEKEASGQRGHWLEIESSQSAYTDKEASGQRKDALKLIGYTGSKTESTRMQALKSIVELSYKSDELLYLLQTANAAETLKKQEPYIWDFCDASVQIYSRMALSCVQEDHLFRLMRSYVGSDASEHSLLEFFRTNPGDSYRAIRVLANDLYKLGFGVIEVMLEEIERLVHISPEGIEWEEVDKVYERWFSFASDASFYLRKAPRFLPTMCCMIEKLPRTRHSSHFRDWIKDLKNGGGMHMMQSYWLLGHFVAGVIDQAALDRVWRGYFNFLSAADMVLSRIALDRGSDSQLLYIPSTDWMLSRIIELVSFCSSVNEHLRLRGRFCSSVLLEHDVYTRNLVHLALSRSPLPHQAELLLSTGARCKPPGAKRAPEKILRHCDAQGYLVHLCYFIDYEDDSKLCTKRCHSEYSLELSSFDFLCIDYTKDKPVQLPTGVVPLIAGYTSGDQRALLASETCALSIQTDFYVVLEGEKIEDYPPNLILFGQKENIPERMYVWILRYEADAYPRRWGSAGFMAGMAEGMDATGPYSWKFERSLFSCDDLDLDSIPPMDEDTEIDGFETADEGYDSDATDTGFVSCASNTKSDGDAVAAAPTCPIHGGLDEAMADLDEGTDVTHSYSLDSCKRYTPSILESMAEVTEDSKYAAGSEEAEFGVGADGASISEVTSFVAARENFSVSSLMQSNI